MLKKFWNLEKKKKFSDFVRKNKNSFFKRKSGISVEGFHVTSYQANCASHHTRDSHVGFLFPQSGIGKHNKMSPELFI